MKHIAIIDEHKSAEKLGVIISGCFTFSASEREEEFVLAVSERKPDAVIINADFAAEKTEEIIRAVRAYPLLSKIPILLTTYDNNCEHQSALCQSGADDVMHFPLCRELIIRHINQFVPNVETQDNNDTERVAFDDLMDMVSEKKYEKGGYLVKRNDFANIYRFVMRGLERSRKHVQVLLMTLNYSMEIVGEGIEKDIMRILSDAVKLCLRRGDISSVCSKNQIIILLMDADDDGGHLVANRIVSNFYGECDDENFQLQYDIRAVDRAV